MRARVGRATNSSTVMGGWPSATVRFVPDFGHEQTLVMTF